MRFSTKLLASRWAPQSRNYLYGFSASKNCFYYIEWRGREQEKCHILSAEFELSSSRGGCDRGGRRVFVVAVLFQPRTRKIRRPRTLLVTKLKQEFTK